MRVGIIGAGFAGVSAAQLLAESGVRVTLFSEENVLPYYRYLLPQFAFGHEHKSSMFFHEHNWYEEREIDLRLDSKVSFFNSDFEVFLESDIKEKFDSLIVTSGASPLIPCSINVDSKSIFKLWSYSDAFEFKKHLKKNKHVAIIGGGLVGIEAALRADSNEMSVTILEKNSHVLSRYFSNKALKVIENQLHERNIDLILNNDVCEISRHRNSLEIDLKDKDAFLCDIALVTTGSCYDSEMALKSGLTTDCRILVDEYLQTSSPGIFAAGDNIQFKSPLPCSGKEASAQGNFVAQNVLAYLNGSKLMPYNPKPSPIHFKYGDFEFCSLGKVPEIGTNENVIDYDSMNIYRACVYENSAMAGVQMVGNCKYFMKYYEDFFIKRSWEILKNTEVF